MRCPLSSRAYFSATLERLRGYRSVPHRRGDFYGVGLRHDDFILTIVLWVPMLLVWQAGSGVGAWCLDHRT